MSREPRPMLIAPPVGGEIELVLDEEFVRRLKIAGCHRAAARAGAIAPGARQRVSARVIRTPSEARVLAADRPIHVRCHFLAGDELLAVTARDCDLPAATQASAA